MAFIFSDEEWQVILNMLSLAGVAHNITAIEPESKGVKNLNRAVTIMKILKYFS